MYVKRRADDGGECGGEEVWVSGWRSYAFDSHIFARIGW
jgi:hypothetical protein